MTLQGEIMKFQQKKHSRSNMSSKQRVLPASKTILLVLILVTPLLALRCIGQDEKATPAADQDQKKDQKTVSHKTDEEANSHSGIAELKTEKGKQSYALGMNVGNQVKAQSMEVDLDLIIRGLKDSLSGSSTLLSDQEASTEVRELQHEVKQKAIAQRREKLKKNKQEGEEFLAANKTKEGVVTLPSGLQYKVLKAGEGKKPSGSDVVFCNYRGTLLNGMEFDSSYKHGKKPAAFAFPRVMRGWKEALQLMPEGAKWQIFVPSDLAYGASGAGKVIEPNSTLIFDLELVSIKSRVPNAEEAQSETTPDSEVGIVQQQAAEPGAANAGAPLSDIRISFKLDPRLSGATYGGERWIASSPFTSLAQVGTQATVEVKADGVAQNGAPVRAAVEWKPADPEMVTVAPGENSQVKITVHHAGESKVTVASNGVSKQLIVKAKYTGNATQVEISQ
jgi:FKBP-type peptidyl-prolyl cis-trans isomerase FklB